MNTNHPWAGRDDVTELYFRDWAHLHKVFSSDYVKTDVAPDGLKFADIESSIALLVSEKSLTLRSPTVDRTPLEGSRTVAVLWLSALQGSGDPARLEELLSPKLISALEAHAAGEVWGLDANVAIESEGFDLKGYFGGSKTPDYALAYKISLKDHASVTSVRKAQATFFEDARDYLDLYDSFILFGIEGLIMDVANDKRVKIPGARAVHSD